MPAYVVIEAEILDEDLLAEYHARFRPLLAEAGGKVMMVGDVVESIDEEFTTHHRVMVWEFDSVEQAREWYQLPQRSPQYAELAELRDRAAKMNRFIIQGDE